jgi:hypothetical protein
MVGFDCGGFFAIVLADDGFFVPVLVVKEFASLNSLNSQMHGLV